MRYTASSVQKELFANTDLSIEGNAVCPPDPNWIGNLKNEIECKKNPQRCELAFTNTCNQMIHIFRNKQLLTVISFQFTISPENNDGFIDAEDYGLGRLIDKNLIDAAHLYKIP